MEAFARGEATLESALGYSAGVSVFSNSYTIGFGASAGLAPPHIGLSPIFEPGTPGMHSFSEPVEDSIQGELEMFVGLRLSLLLTSNGVVEVEVPVTAGVQFEGKANTDFLTPVNVTGVPVAPTRDVCETCHLSRLGADFVAFDGAELIDGADFGTIPVPVLPDIRLRDSVSVDILNAETAPLFVACFDEVVDGPADMCMLDPPPNPTPTPPECPPTTSKSSKSSKSSYVGADAFGNGTGRRGLTSQGPRGLRRRRL